MGAPQQTAGLPDLGRRQHGAELHRARLMGPTPCCSFVGCFCFNSWLRNNSKR